ncbi:non-ribosomal peptide synthetase [Microbulbifer halophilus]|uniref:Non-ribosomal peptide synthetase n=1 Tax=Microbulbifer halophilus TaxID=453963 RepID=A0ABW5EFV3_9GAMM|nr:non-ribosomal peptide synthetase [Microbulbifer halophilus]MCW8128216.1 amino acid adenylation domain-containing protein [Microbulbifer halophilus]
MESIQELPPTSVTLHPLTELQRQLWMLSQLGPAGSLAYNISINLRLRGALDRALLRKSIETVWARHDALRTSISSDGKHRCVHLKMAPDTKLVDISKLPEEKRLGALREQITHNCEQPFDFSRGPLFRVRLYRLATDHHLLMLTAHHIVSDGWSLSLLLREIVAVYASVYDGNSSELPEAMQFDEFLAADAARGANGKKDRNHAYWRDLLQAPLPLTKLPCDFRRPRTRSFRAARANRRLGEDYTKQLRSRAANKGATLFMLLFTAFSVLLHRICRQNKLLIGTPSAGRFVSGSDTLVGYCGSLLPIVSQMEPNMEFGAHLARMREQLLEAYEHQEFSFARLIDELPVERGGNRSVLIDAIFNLELPVSLETIPGLELNVEPQATPYTSYDLFFNISEINGSLSLDLDFNLDIFRPETVDALMSGYCALLDNVLADPNCTVRYLDLLGENERGRLARVNTTTLELPDEQSIHGLIERHAIQTPDAISLLIDDIHVSYGMLNAASNRLATHLLEKGVQPEDRVGLCIDRSLAQFVSVLAILKAGAAYVPLDPEHPDERLRLVAEQAGISILLTQLEYRSRVVLEGAPVIEVDVQALAAGHCSSNRRGTVSPEQLAYLIYTSGSTGQPKGISVSHSSVLNLVAAMQCRPGFSSNDRLLAITTFSFDMSVVEMFLPLCSGGTVVIAPSGSVFDAEGFVSRLANEQISLVQATPAAWRLVTGCDRSWPVQIRLLCGGEALPLGLKEKLISLGGELWNMYGPSETTVWSSCHLCQVDGERDASSNVSIGKPLANTSFYILDAALQPVPVGVPGTLYVGGLGLARGYWDRPDLTAASFLPDPFSGKSGARMYDTGDLARWLPDGSVDFLGRADNQVKVRGYRIELGEIEAVLWGHPGVEQAAVIAVKDERGDNRLHAFVQPRDDVDPEALRDHLRQHLPHYMVPASWKLLSAMPLTLTKKIDRRALPKLIPEKEDMAGGYIAPRTSLEANVCSEWSELLRVPRVGINDDFFTLGGHSLLAVELVNRLRDHLGLQVNLESLLARPTVSGLMQTLAERPDDENAVNAQLPPIKPNPEERYTPFPLTPIQEAYWIGRSPGLELGNTPAFNYNEVHIGRCDPSVVRSAWKRIVGRHDMLRMRVDAEGRQVITADTQPPDIAIHDIAALPREDRDAALERVREEMTIRDPGSSPWADIRLSRIGEDDWILHFYLDMMIFDGASLNILYRELALLIDEPDAELEPLQVTFRDFVLAERSLRDTPAYNRAREYWIDRLDTLPLAPNLPMAMSPSSLVYPRFSRRCVEIDAVKWGHIKQAAQKNGITPSVLAMTAFAEVIGCWAEEPAFTINVTLFNRLALHPQINNVIGDFTSLNLLEIDHRTAASFVERGRAAQHQLWRDLEHRQFGGVEVIRELNQRRGGGLAATMPVVFTSDLSIFEQAPQSPTERRLADQRVGVSHTPQTFLDMAVMETDGALTVLMDAVDALFPAGMLDAMLDSYRALLERLATDTLAWSGKSALSLPPDQTHIREQANATSARWSEALLHAGFQEQASRRPDAMAVWSSSRQLTYGQLRKLVRHYAHALRNAGARPGELVAVVMRKGWEQVVAVLAVLEAGAAYLPIDADLPAARIDQLLSLGEVKRVLTEPGADRDVAWPKGLSHWVVDVASLSGEELPPLEPLQDLQTLAYVIFTSGSTGQPKGVMIDHRGARNTIDRINTLLQIGSGDRILAVSSLSFDLSVYDVFGLLAAGGVVVMPDAGQEKDPAHWSQLLSSAQVTVWNTVPSLMQLLLEYHEQHEQPLPDSLREVMLSGDWIPVGLPDRIRALAPGVRVRSLGGATEASIWSIHYLIDRVDPTWTSIPYGYPLANQTYHVLKSDLSPCPDWVPGDLYIGGIGLAQGYWRDTEKTDAAFVTVSGERLYRTGDLGCYRPDGSIKFLGRRDSQVKIRGYRIELGEIEAALQRQPHVRDAAVIAAGETAQHQRLVAYVVPEAAPEAASTTAEQALFKLSRPGLRTVEDVGIELPRPTGKLGLSWSAAAGGDEAPDVPTLGGWLGALLAMSVEGASLPKHYYPSTGSLNPVRAYLEVGEDMSGLLSGTYYYDPVGHRLQRVGAAGGKGMRLHLVAARRAVEPVYGADSVQLCEIEAGYMLELLRLAAPVHGIALSVVEAAGAAELQGLEATEQLLASLSVTAAAVQPASVRLGLLERQSYRHFAGRSLKPEQLAAVLSALQASAGVKWYAQVTPGSVDGLEAGYYRLGPTAETCVLLETGREVSPERYDGGAGAAYTQRALAIYAVAAPTPDLRLSCGMQGQRLSVAAVKAGVGVCPIGGFHAPGLSRRLGAEAGTEVVHSWLLGAIDAEMTRRWELEPVPVPPEERLREALAETLPEYMVPSALVLVERIPLTANGKVDRQALPAPPEAAQRSRSRPPRTEMESLLASIWREVLDRENVGIDDHFFEIGGDSMRLIRMRMKLNAKLDRRVDLVDLFKHPTIGQLATSLERGADEGDGRRERTRAQAQRQKEAALRSRRRREREVTHD